MSDSDEVKRLVEELQSERRSRHLVYEALQEAEVRGKRLAEEIERLNAELTQHKRKLQRQVDYTARILAATSAIEPSATMQSPPEEVAELKRLLADEGRRPLGDQDISQLQTKLRAGLSAGLLTKNGIRQLTHYLVHTLLYESESDT